MDIVIDGDDYVLLAMRTAHYEGNLSDGRFNIDFLEKHASAMRTIGDFHASLLADMFFVFFVHFKFQTIRG